MGEQWDRLHGWLHSVAIVTFDLELGQVIESVYPGTEQHEDALSEQDKTNICYLAFPDSNSGIMGDVQFHFRIRRSRPCFVPNSLNSQHTVYNAKCLPTLQMDNNFLFGFAYFRQVKDATIRRGYYQKSVILLTYLPLITLYTNLTNIVARKYFESGDVSVEVACHDIDQWPAPTPGDHLTLPVLGSLLQLHLPHLNDQTSIQETVSWTGSGVSMSSVSSCTELFTVLSPLLEHLHTLWELALTAEPLVVQAASPAQCSALTQALTTIIHPLTFLADYRPFYTIHDTDFKELTSSNSSALPSIILGVTNPFFNKVIVARLSQLCPLCIDPVFNYYSFQALQHWPNLIRLTDPTTVSKSPVKSKPKMNSKFKNEHKPGVFTNSKPLLDKDKEIIKKVLKGVQLKRPVEVQTALLRRYFLELTQTFIIPLERYLASLMPLAKTISPYRAPPKVRPFSCDDFIKSLEANGPQLTSRIKGDWAGLYKRFLKSPNFVGWFNARAKEMSAKLTLLHLESLSEAKIVIWMEGKAEVELVDMVLRIRNKLSEAKKDNLALADIIIERLEGHVTTIVKTLPSDLQTVIANNQPG